LLPDALARRQRLIGQAVLAGVWGGSRLCPARAVPAGPSHGAERSG
jgi:hypothetical protein